MMRENESDGEDGWRPPPGYVSPRTPRDFERDQGRAGGRWSSGSAAPPPGDGYPDTIAFGTPPSPGREAGYGPRPGYESQPGYGSQPGNGQQAGYGQGWYGHRAGYGEQAGSGARGGYGDPAGYRDRERYGGPDRAAGQDWYGERYEGYGNQPGLGPPELPPRRSGWGGRLLVYVAVAALAAGIGAGATVALGHHGAAPTAGISSNDVPAPHDNASGSGAASARLDPVAVQRKVDPGLVDIVATLKYNGETAEGTGMIISSSGLVLTNNHVIDGATAVRASLVEPGRNDTKTFVAEVVGYDVSDDVALLRLQGAAGLPTESFGNSSQVKLGTPVLALGNAEGRGGAKPAPGIINALDRSIQASDEGSNTTENLRHMLQTDARIQQGDSGGALANNAGQVIGMITAANTGPSSPAGSSGGTLGFAIPINSALAIARQIASGQPSATVYIGLPGFLGVEVATSSSQDPRQQAADHGQAGGRRDAAATGSCQTGSQQSALPARVAPIAAGALVVGVLCDTAASSARMVPGDVITSVNGQPITTPASLMNTTARYHPGTIVTVQWVSLDGVQHTTRMMLGHGPAR
jgi:S1-C subfamily serine protease